MPRYFFNVYGATRRRDYGGQDLPDKKAAWHEATTRCGRLLEELDGDLHPGHELKFEVADEFSDPLYSINIRVEAFK